MGKWRIWVYRFSYFTIYCVFYTCKLFGLRGRDEHRNLMGSQFEIGHDSTGKYLRFVGRDSKTFKGGLGQLKLNTKDIKHYSDGGTRCIIDFFELYLKAVGDGTFYRKPLNPGTKEKFRYGKHPLGINKLNSMMKEICQKGGLLGNFTNHSGKRTCATALYRAGVDEQEIMERTGHRSTAVRQYKTTSGDIQKKVSSVLSPPVENKKPEYSFEPQTKIPNTLQTFNENATKRVLSDVLPVENKPENSFEPPTKIPNTVQKADENVTKRVLSDVTNMQGGFIQPMEDDLVKHTGGCHCGAVKFEVLAPKVLYVYDCNCSICKKKVNKHFVVPKSRFKLLQGEDNITTYTFNTHVAKHMFCKTCGVQSFYSPRSNPDGYGVMPHCIDSDTIEDIIEQTFDGENWEDFIGKSDIRQRSKE